MATPTELEERIRQRYNAVGDDFFTQALIYDFMFQAQEQLALETLCIENRFSTTTVIDQREYQYPDKAIRIKRLEVNGEKMEPIDLRDDDTLTVRLSTTTERGTPQYYAVFDNLIFLRPIPDAALSMLVFTFDRPDEITTSSQNLDVPERYHTAIQYFALSQMYAKDNNFSSAQYYEALWQTELNRAKRYQKKRLRGDAFPRVKDEAEIPVTVLGIV